MCAYVFVLVFYSFKNLLISGAQLRNFEKRIHIRGATEKGTQPADIFIIGRMR